MSAAEYNQMNEDSQNSQNNKEEMMEQNEEQNYSQDFHPNDGGANNNNNNGDNSQDDGNYNGNGNGTGNANQDESVANNNQDGQDNNGNDENGNGDAVGNDNNGGEGGDGGASLEPEQFRKVFIGGLSYKTDDDALKAYFSKYGELVDHVVMKDGQTGRSRGFGFVTYSNSSMVDELMKNRPHIIDGRQVEPKRATPREVSFFLFLCIHAKRRIRRLADFCLWS